MAFDFKSAFANALPYKQFLDTYASAEDQKRWTDFAATVELSPDQKALLAGFRRRMPVLCLAGVWCGDCVNACPIFHAIASASPVIDLRFVHRERAFFPQAGDLGTRLANELSICGGPRVPVLVFLSEDFYECERFGERTLATYRQKAASRHGASCSTGLFAGPSDLVKANIAEWLTHFERIQLMLQISPRLMKLNGEA
jgi:ferredoxin